MGQSITTRHCVLGVEAPESRAQVFMYTSGDLAVHDKVVFEANTAGQYGGAVSLPFNANSPPFDV